MCFVILKQKGNLEFYFEQMKHVPSCYINPSPTRIKCHDEQKNNKSTY